MTRRALHGGETIAVFLFFFLPEFIFYTTPHLPIKHNLYFADLNSIFYTSRMVTQGFPPETVVQPDLWLPVPYYANALGLLIFGDSVSSLYKTSAVVSGFAGVALYRLLRLRLPRIVCWLVLPFFAFLTGKLSNIGYAAQYTATFALWAAYFFCAYVQSPTSRRRLFTVGLCLGFAYCGKFEIASTIVVAVAAFLLLEPVWRTGQADVPRPARGSVQLVYLLTTAFFAAAGLVGMALLGRRLNVWVLTPAALVLLIVLMQSVGHLRRRRAVLADGEWRRRCTDLTCTMAGFALSLTALMLTTHVRTGRAFSSVLRHYLPVFEIDDMLEVASAYAPHLSNEDPLIFFQFFAIDRTLFGLLILGAAAAVAWRLLSPLDWAATPIHHRSFFDRRHLQKQRWLGAAVAAHLGAAAWLFVHFVRIADAQNKVFYLLVPVILLVLMPSRRLRFERVTTVVVVFSACAFAVLLRSLVHNIIYEWLFLPLALMAALFAVADTRRKYQPAPASWILTTACIAMYAAVGIMAYGHLRYQGRRSGLAWNEFYSCYTTPARDAEIRALREYLQNGMSPEAALFALSNNRIGYVLSNRCFANVPSLIAHSSVEDRLARSFISERHPAVVLTMIGVEDDPVSLEHVRKYYPDLVARVERDYPNRRLIGSFLALERPETADSMLAGGNDDVGQ